MHDSSSWLAGPDRCFRPSFHCFKRKLHLPAVDLDGVPSGASPHDNVKDTFCSRRISPLCNEFHLSGSSAESRMRQQTSLPSLAKLLRACGENGSISEARHAHALLVECGVENQYSLQNPLFQLYAKCGALNDANALFSDMHFLLSVVSWNVLISCCMREGERERAVQVFNRMPAQALVPTKVTYICMISECITEELLVYGKLIHACISASQFESGAAVFTSILIMYGRCGMIEYARRTFNDMQDRDVVTWNAMIEVYHEHGLYIESFALFLHMQVEGQFPNTSTLVTTLDTCANLGALFEGTLIHLYAIGTGLILEAPVATAIVCMYGKLGRVAGGVYLFKSFCCQRDTVLWNAMIAMYFSHGRCKDALQTANQMLQEGFLPTKITYATILNVCASQAASFVGKCFHASIHDDEMEMDSDVANAIVHMYGKLGSIEDALFAFEKMREKDIVLWSTMIAAFAEVGECKRALQAFHLMQEKGIMPNKVTIVNILKAFEGEADVDDILEIHDYVLSHGLDEDVIVGTAIISVYSKCGDLECARIVFKKLIEHDVFSWTAMISSCVQHGQCNEALLLFYWMNKKGVVPDKVAIASILTACSELDDALECERMYVFIQNLDIKLDETVGSALLTMFGRFGKLSFAKTLFDSLPKTQASTWNSMMIVHIQHGQFRMALELFFQMCLTTVIPDKDTSVSALTACTNETSLIDGLKVHALIRGGGLISSETVVAALVNMYGKCGCVDTAKHVFNHMQGKGLLLWNAMVGVYAQHGESTKVLQAMHEMSREDCIPDTITTISVLNACSHTGLSNEGLQFLAVMEHVYNISPIMDQYVCVIDMLGRSGRLREAELLLHHMAFQPKAVSYMSLLGACQSLANSTQGERAARCMSELASENAGPYISLSNIYVLQHNKSVGS